MSQNIIWKIDGIFKANANLVYKEVIELSKECDDNEAKPQDIVDYAKAHPKSELHKCFEWNNKKAADAYRRQQARYIVSNLVTVITPEDTSSNQAITSRVIHTTVKKTGYKPVVFMTPDEYSLIIKRAWEELNDWKNKYGKLQDAGIQAVVKAIG